MNDKDLSYLQNMYVFSKRVSRRIAGVSMASFLENEDITDKFNQPPLIPRRKEQKQC